MALRGRLWKNIRYYRVVQIAALSMVPYKLSGWVSDRVAAMLGITDGVGTHALYELYRTAVYVLMWGLWAWWAFRIERGRRYARLTGGRSYSADHGKYRRTYYQLVDYFHDAEPQKMNTEELPDKTWKESGGLIFGAVGSKLISFEPVRNGIVAFDWGAPGDGKTASHIITSAQRFGMRKTKDGRWVQRGAVMVLDLKGDIYNANNDVRHIKRISTIDWEHSCHFDPLAEIRDMGDDDRAEALCDQAVTLMPDQNSDNGQFFVGVGRDFHTAIFLFMLHEDLDIDFPEVCDQITLHDHEYWGEIIERSGYEPAMRYIMHYKAESSKNTAGGYGVLVKAVQLYTYESMRTILSRKGDSISYADLEKCTDIYIQVDPVKLGTTYAPFVAMLFQVLMSKALGRGEGKKPPIAFILDEFGQIPAMPVIKQSAALMRGYNCSIFISCQSLAQVDNHYGENGRKTLLDCSKVHCFLSITDPDTRMWASNLIGTKKVLKLSNSVNTQADASKSDGVSVTEERERSVEPEEFALLPGQEKQIVYCWGHYTKADITWYFGKKNKQ